MSFEWKIETLRGEVRRIWESEVTQTITFHTPVEMPDYFLDRYSYRLFKHEQSGPGPFKIFTKPVQQLEHLWEERIKKIIGRIESFPNSNINAFCDVATGDYLCFLTTNWENYLGELGWKFPSGHFRIPRGTTWIELFRSSVLYPQFLPAIRSPRFFDRMGEAQRHHILERHGIQGVWDFFIFLTIVHDRSHALQKGDPMLCEFLLSYIWCRFLSAADLWYWQENQTTLECYNLERQWTGNIQFGSDVLIALLEDTLSGVRFSRTQYPYEYFCHLTFEFDQKKIRYKEYINSIYTALK